MKSAVSSFSPPKMGVIPHVIHRLRCFGPRHAAQRLLIQPVRRWYRSDLLIYAGVRGADATRIDAHDNYVVLCPMPAECSDVLKSGCAHWSAPRRYAAQALLSEGANFAGALSGDAIVAIAWYKEGHQLQHWYVPVDAHDRISFAWYTDPAHRGRHLTSLLLTCAARQPFESGGRLLCDIFDWNHPSRRAAERWGFREIARLTRHEAAVARARMT